MSITKVTYAMIQGAAVNVLDYGATGDGVTDDSSAIQAALTAGAGNAVYIPAGNYKLEAYVTIPNNTYVYGDGEASRIFGDGTLGELLRGVWPCEFVTVDNLCLDGGKTQGTGPIVVCFYTSASTTQTTTYNRNITIRNCVIKNANAGIGIENGQYISVHDNTIYAMYYQQPGNPGANVYGYGVVLNGCTRSQVMNNIIGRSGGLIQRHAIYTPVFRDADVSPTFTNFCEEIKIVGNTCHVDDSIDPYSSCIESWSFFDFLIADNILIGGQRGIDSTPEYKNGSRVMIVNNIIKDSHTGIRCDRAIYGAAPSTYYFEEWLIDGNQILPILSTSAVQAVSLQGVKKITFTNNYVRHTGSASFGFGYYGAINHITSESIVSANNTISGFTQGFYLADVDYFIDTASVFSNFTGSALPYVRVTNIDMSEMTPRSTPYEEYYVYSGTDWTGVSYFSNVLLKQITFNSSFWQDAMGIRVRGTTANRPNTTGLPYGFKYYDTDVGAIVTWNGSAWV